MPDETTSLPESGHANGALPRLTERVLEALATAILVTDAEGRVLLANRRALQIIERERAAVVGKPVGELFPEVAALIAASPRDPDPARSQLRFRARDGRELVIGFTAAPIPDASGPGPCFAVLFRDITAAERLQAERDRLLQTAAAGRLFPAMLHELRNPLSAATSTLELLLEEPLDQELTGTLRALLGELRRMTLTLDGVGLLPADRNAVKHIAVDEALADAFRILEPLMRRKGIEGRCELPALPLLAFDRAAIRAVAFNLLNNAIQACATGATIRLAAALLPGPGLELTVEDTGPGMAPEVLAQCRELFFTTRPGGTGVGLALCQLVVDRGGGQMQIESAPGRGTRVRVRLPCVAGPAARTGG